MGLGVEIDKPGATGLNWTHADRIGSVVAISDQSGSLRERLAYDSWGKRRELTGNATPDAVDGVTDNKGFTGHEMLDQLDLVHMNGRIYDPLVARFMSADPLIQDPEHSQSYNRYTYVWNNPTNLTDPTGFQVQGDKSPRPEDPSCPTSLPQCRDLKKKSEQCARQGNCGIVGAYSQESMARGKDNSGGKGTDSANNGVVTAISDGLTAANNLISGEPGTKRRAFNDQMHDDLMRAAESGCMDAGSTSICIGPGSTKAVGGKLFAATTEAAESAAKALPQQLHHFATDKSKKYTDALSKIAEKYGLHLDGAWNKEMLSHQGRHPNAYHEFVLDSMKRIDKAAAGSQEKFLQFFNTYVKEPVRQAPEMLRKEWWK